MSTTPNSPAATYPAERSRAVLRAFHAASCIGWTAYDGYARMAARLHVLRIQESGAETPHAVALAIRNFDWMRDEARYPVTERQLQQGAAYLEILQAFASGGPEAVKALS